MAQNELLLGLAQAGLTVSAVALALFLLRRTLKKRYPARAVCVIWALLAVRLLFPVQLDAARPAHTAHAAREDAVCDLSSG